MGEDRSALESVRPAAIHLDRSSSLTIRWTDGRESVYPLAYLRSRCPCATCRTAAPQTASLIGGAGAGGVSLNVLPAGFDRRATASGASLVGNYALQMIWADGHDTGIYDFAYLRSLDNDAPRANAT